MIRRRAVLAGVVGMTLARPSLSQEPQIFADDPPPPLPASWSGLPDKPLSEFGTGKIVGTDPATVLEARVAAALIAAAPFNCAPIRVANYWRKIGTGEEFPKLIGDLAALNASIERRYASAWPVRYNPVIIEMFRATRTDPLAAGMAGDQTHWCGAFVNWCIVRGASKTGGAPRFSTADLAVGASNAASSGRFRCWGEETKAPQYGDIVVWSESGPNSGCGNGRGHVGFYVGTNPDGRIATLGGNQTGPDLAEATRRAVVQRNIPVVLPGRRVGSASSGSIILNSYRSAAFLRSGATL